MAKKITWAILIISVIVGIVMMFLGSSDMDRYTLYVKGVAFIYVPLVTSIGTNSAIDKVKGMKDEKAV